MSFTGSFKNIFTYKISENIEVPRHARTQMRKRAVSEREVIETVERGEALFKEIDKRFGTKYHNCLRGVSRDLIVVWFTNKQGKKEVVTVYWRRKR